MHQLGYNLPYLCQIVKIGLILTHLKTMLGVNAPFSPVALPLDVSFFTVLHDTTDGALSRKLLTSLLKAALDLYAEILTGRKFH